MIVVSLTKIADYTKALKSGADAIEIRTDYFTDAQLKQLVERSTLPVVFTVKRPTQYRPKVKWVDGGTHETIHSFHDYKRTPSFERLNEMVQTIRKQRKLPKVATQINSVDELAVIAKLQRKYGKKIIAIGMGQLGLVTRVYNQGLFTFASIGKATTAPGQLTVQQTKATRIFGLIGSDIRHSLSPRLHKGNGYLYQLWETQNLAQFMIAFNFFKLPGASVTMPYKQDVMAYCDKLDVHAKKIGAVNTLVRKGKQLVGYNTDWLGVQAVIGKQMRGKRVVILGKGGVAKAVAYAAKQSHAKKINLLGRLQLSNPNSLFLIRDSHVIVNATPVRDQLLVPKETLKGKVVMDCIYGKPTVLVKTAKQQHAKQVFDGLPMLKAQALAQINLWR